MAPPSFGGADGIVGRASVLTPPMEEPKISDNLPPLPAPPGSAPLSKRAVQPQIAVGASSDRVIRVKSGQARFLTFRRNILSVYFSNTAVMDARALNGALCGCHGNGCGRFDSGRQCGAEPDGCHRALRDFHHQSGASHAQHLRFFWIRTQPNRL